MVSNNFSQETRDVIAAIFCQECKTYRDALADFCSVCGMELKGNTVYVKPEEFEND